VVVAGQMEKLVTVEGTNLQGKGLADVLVFSLTSTGGKRWARSFGSPDKDQAWGVAADASGQVTISGDIRGQINMDGHTLQSKGQTDAFVAGLAGATGKVGWVRQAGSTMSDHAIGVRADSAGNVHVTGAFSGSFSLGGPTLYAQGSTDAFVAKLDSKGAHLWSRALGGTGGAQGWGIDVDAAGNVYVVGWHEGLQFEGKPHPTAGLSDVFVLSLTPLGKTRWLATAGGTNGDFGYGVAASGAGVTVLGSFQQTVDFGGGPLSATSQLDLFLWQLTP
jgi:hypothetical protein